MKINVFLDDSRKCPEGYILAEDIDQCLALLENHAIAHLSLDHDLVNKYRNGLLLVEKWLSTSCMRIGLQFIPQTRLAVKQCIID